jgi:predicted nucleic acid-binding protein
VGSLLLDTTVVIDLLRGRSGAVARLRALRDAGDAPYISAINVEETVRGLMPDESDRVRALFAGLREAPLGSSEGWVAGEWRRDFAARGVTLSQADCLVAASAAAISGRLATGNPRDFPMDGVAVEHWPVGE